MSIKDKELPPLDDEDYIIFRILKLVKRKGDPATLMFDFNSISDYDNVDDDDSQLTVPNRSLEAHSLITYNITDYSDGYNYRDESEMTVQWEERYRTRLSSVEIQNVHPRMIELQLGVGDDVILRDFCFDSLHEVETFVKVFEKCVTYNMNGVLDWQ